MNKIIVPHPPKEAKTVGEKLDFYNKLIKEGLNVEELKVVKRRLDFLDTYFEEPEVILQKDTILQCIEEMLEEA